MSDIEYCCICDEPTERAGKSDDSMYLDTGQGPFCINCYQEAVYGRYEDMQTEITSLRQQVAELNQDLSRCKDALEPYANSENYFPSEQPDGQYFSWIEWDNGCVAGELLYEMAHRKDGISSQALAGDTKKE